MVVILVVAEVACDAVLSFNILLLSLASAIVPVKLPADKLVNPAPFPVNELASTSPDASMLTVGFVKLTFSVKVFIPLKVCVEERSATFVLNLLTFSVPVTILLASVASIF